MVEWQKIVNLGKSATQRLKISEKNTQVARTTWVFVYNSLTKL